MEAMASGMPVLSTFHTGIPELIQDGRAGFLAPERDIDSLANKMEFLCQHPELWRAFGQNGRSFVAKNHNINRLNEQLQTVYKMLLAEQLQITRPL